MTQNEVPARRDERQPPPELPVLELFQGWKSFFPEDLTATGRPLAEKLRRQFLNDVLPSFLVNQRWFAAKGEQINSVEIERQFEWGGEGNGAWLLMQIEVRLSVSGTQRYFLPLSLSGQKNHEDRINSLGPAIVAKTRAQAETGVLYDAFADEAFCQALLGGMEHGSAVPLRDGQLRFKTTGAFRQLAGKQPSNLPVHRPPIDSSNTTAVVGDKLFLKGYRKLQKGISLEWEVGRFLTEVSPFDHIVPLAGTVEYEEADGNVTTLALLQGFVANQGDAWAYTQAALARFFEGCLKRPDGTEADASGHLKDYLLRMHTLGQRTGELHKALAVQSGDPAFDPEPIQNTDLQALTRQIVEDAEVTLAKLELQREQLPEALREDSECLVRLRHEVVTRINAFEPSNPSAVKTRYHGDYHLGQVLLCNNDFLIIDFEGEPARTLAERRRKQSPLKDVAGMLRSFDYAAFAALSSATSEAPDQLAQLEPFARHWRRRTSLAFMEGYEGSVAGCPCYPQGSEVAKALIDLFSVEKALYELRYELDNRPDWVGVPLRGLLELLV
jgi:maltose alpha-D-glucosyltransferase/alpha-amylase